MNIYILKKTHKIFTRMSTCNCVTMKLFSFITELTFAIVCLIKLAVWFNESSSMSTLCCSGSLGPHTGAFFSNIPNKSVLSSIFLFLFSKRAILGINLGAVDEGFWIFLVLTSLSADTEFTQFEDSLERSGEGGIKLCRDPILSSVGALVCRLCDLNLLEDKHCWGASSCAGKGNKGNRGHSEKVLLVEVSVWELFPTSHGADANADDFACFLDPVSSFWLSDSATSLCTTVY